MSSPAIQSVLEQMQILSGQAVNAPGKGGQVNTSVGRGGFAEELYASIQRINQMQVQAAEQVRAFESGDGDMTLNQVMVDLQKAGLAFDAGVQVRNRLVTAYKEIMNLQI